MSLLWHQVSLPHLSWEGFFQSSRFLFISAKSDWQSHFWKEQLFDCIHRYYLLRACSNLTHLFGCCDYPLNPAVSLAPQITSYQSSSWWLLSGLSNWSIRILCSMIFQSNYPLHSVVPLAPQITSWPSSSWTSQSTASTTAQWNKSMEKRSTKYLWWDLVFSIK